jgi:transposase
VVTAAPCACPACGGTRLSKVGEDVTETLEVIPRTWKVIQTVRVDAAVTKQAIGTPAWC